MAGPTVRPPTTAKHLYDNKDANIRLDSSLVFQVLRKESNLTR